MASHDAEVIPLLPLHLDPKSTGRRARGRPQSVEPAPVADSLRYHAEVLAERAAVVDADALVVAARRQGDPKEVLRLVIEMLSQDAAALAHVRNELAKRGKQTDVAQITSRRAAILDRVASLTIEVDKLGTQLLDVRSDAMMTVFELWVAELREVALDVLSPEQLSVFFAKLEAKLQGFERRAEERLR